MILIFDGNNTFFRNFAANPASDVNGVPTGGIVGTINSVKWLLHETKASKVIVVWDAPGGSKKRRAILEEYKAGRKPRMNREVDETVRDSADNLVWQFSKVKKILETLGVIQIEVQDIEADDAIGYLVGLFDPLPKVVVSSDKDMWQLVSPTTTVYWPVKKVYITPGTFREQVPFLPENYVLARALSGQGDTSDNVRGIKGLGEKTIVKIFPKLIEIPLTVDEFFTDVRQQLEQTKEKPKEFSATQKRWLTEVLANEELVRRNVQVMQLTSPIIGTSAAHIIRTAAFSAPKFELVSFKLSLINSGIQLTGADLFTTFQEYRVRAQKEMSSG